MLLWTSVCLLHIGALRCSAPPFQASQAAISHLPMSVWGFCRWQCLQTACISSGVWNWTSHWNRWDPSSLHQNHSKTHLRRMQVILLQIAHTWCSPGWTLGLQLEHPSCRKLSACKVSSNPESRVPRYPTLLPSDLERLPYSRKSFSWLWHLTYFQPVGQILPAGQLRMVFTLLNGWNKNSKDDYFMI